MSDYDNSSYNPDVLVIKRQTYTSPFGDKVEILWTKSLSASAATTVNDQNFEIKPPLADGIVPATIHEIRTCRVCRGLFHHTSCRKCSLCGYDFCGHMECYGYANKDRLTRICAICADKENTPAIVKAYRALWEIS